MNTTLEKKNCHCNLEAFFYDNISKGECIYVCPKVNCSWNEKTNSLEYSEGNPCDFFLSQVVPSYVKDNKRPYCIIYSSINDDLANIDNTYRIRFDTINKVKYCNEDKLENIKSKVKIFKNTKLYEQMKEIESLIEDFNKKNTHIIKLYKKGEDLGDYIEYILSLRS